jgi:hypothetical protein
VRQLALIFLLAGCAAPRQAAVEPMPSPPVAVGNVPRWEHFCATIASVELESGAPRLLDVAGRHGWELATLAYNVNGAATYCFKRPRA